MRIAFVLSLAAFMTAGLASASPTGEVAAREIRSVHIESDAFGLHVSSTESFDLVPQGHDFLLRGQRVESMQFSGKSKTTKLPSQVVGGARVRALATVLHAPAVARVDGIARLASPAWLRAHAGAAYATLLEDGKGCSDDARQLFMSRFTDTRSATAAMNAYYDTQWTDDFPGVLVRVTYADGSVVTADSRSQQAVMLPWTIGTARTWNPAVAESIAAVLPAAAEAQTRLSPQAMLEEFARDVVASVEAQFEAFEGRCRYASVIQKLAPHFDVVEVFFTGPGVLSASLQRAGMPHNLVIDVRLPGGESRVAQQAFARFLERIPTYIDIARPFALAHPDISLELWYPEEGPSFNLENDAVYGEEAAVAFLRTQPRRNEGVLLRQHDVNSGRAWVVLPGGQSVLWDDGRY